LTRFSPPHRSECRPFTPNFKRTPPCPLTPCDPQQLAPVPLVRRKPGKRGEAISLRGLHAPVPPGHLFVFLLSLSPLAVFAVAKLVSQRCASFTLRPPSSQDFYACLAAQPHAPFSRRFPSSPDGFFSLFFLSCFFFFFEEDDTCLPREFPYADVPPPPLPPFVPKSPLLTLTSHRWRAIFLPSNPSFPTVVTTLAFTVPPPYPRF